MSGPADLRPLAELLERAYRLALAVQDTLPLERGTAWLVAGELVDVLDDARVALLSANGAPKAGACSADAGQRRDGMP